MAIEHETVWCEAHGGPNHDPHLERDDCLHPHFTDQRTRAQINRSNRQAMREAIWKTQRAAVENSNDDEIDALRQALEMALARWPGLYLGANGCRHPRRHRDDPDRCAVCAEWP